MSMGQQGGASWRSGGIRSSEVSRPGTAPQATTLKNVARRSYQPGGNNGMDEVVGSPLLRRAQATSPSPKRKPIAWDDIGWSLTESTPQERAKLMSEAIAVRRLIPTNNDSFRHTFPLANSEHQKSGSNWANGRSRSFTDLAPITSPSDFLTVHSVSSPVLSMPPSKPSPTLTRPPQIAQETIEPIAQESGRQGKRPTIAQEAVQAMVQESGHHESRDWKALAEEAAVWLEEMPKQERASAIAEMKQWVNASGLKWETWRQYMQSVRKARRGNPAVRPVEQPLERQMHLLDESGGFRQRPLHAKQISPPQFVKAYGRPSSSSSFPRVAQKVTKTQVQASVNNHLPDTVEFLSFRPRTEQDWQCMAVEALAWLHGLSEHERPMGLSQMRQWIVAVGLSWDRWWEYCQRMQRAMNLPELAVGNWRIVTDGVVQQERQKETDEAQQRTHLVESLRHDVQEDPVNTSQESQSPSSPQPFRLNIPGALDRSHSQASSRQASKQLSSRRPSNQGLSPDEKARLKRIMEEQKVRDAARAKKNEAWTQEREKLIVDEHEHWKAAAREYQKDVDTSKKHRKHHH